MGNRIQREISEGKHVVGPFLKLDNPAIVEIMGKAGFNYVIIDCEHGPTDVLAAENMVRAAKLVGISPVIRVSANDAVMISRALDIGADAVQVPQISTKEDAEAVVKAAKFAPLGLRGSCLYVRAAEYSHLDKKEYFKKANKETMVIIHIEGEEGAENIDEILTVDGIDVIFVGPYDLSQSLGIPGEVHHPKVVTLMEEVVKKSRAKGKTVGSFVESPEGAHKWIDLGVQYISYGGDTGIIYKACRDIVQQITSVNSDA